MGLIDQAKKDIEDITANVNDWAVEFTMTAPTSETVTAAGVHIKINLGVDTDGLSVNSKKAHISISEKYLTAANYPVRNSSGEVNILGHRLDVKDSTGTVKNYTISQCFPDETIGLLSCILEDYKV